MSFLLDAVETDATPLCDMCRCSNCGWSGKTSDCETEMESDGWEMPSYQIHLCPKCEDGGCVDDYFYSEQLWEELEKKNVKG